MKKKLVMKKWVEKVLLVIGLMAVLIGASDYEDTLTFVITHIGAIIVLGLIAVAFVLYGRESD